MNQQLPSGRIIMVFMVLLLERSLEPPRLTMWLPGIVSLLLFFKLCALSSIGTNNWGKYLAVSLLPTTLLFLGTLTSQILTPLVLRRVVNSHQHHTKCL